MRPEIKKIKDSLIQKDLKTAYELILKAKNKLKNYPLLIALEGIFYGEAGDLENALSAFAVAAETMPHDGNLFYNLAATLRGLRRLTAAEEAIRKSLRISPLNPFALYELAQIQTLQGKHNEAIMTLFKCVKHVPVFYPAYAALTQYFLLDDQKNLAIKLYETASAGLPEDSFFKDRLKELKGL